MSKSLQRLRLTRFVYARILFVVWIQLSGLALASWIGRSLRLFRRRPTVAYEVVPDDDITHGSDGDRITRRHGAEGSSPQDFADIYRHLLHLREIYSAIYRSSEDITTQKEEIDDGMAAVRLFLPPKLSFKETQTTREPAAPLEDRGCPDHCAIFPCRRPTPMNSAVRQTTVHFTSQKVNYAWLVSDPEGTLYDFDLASIFVKGTGKWTIPMGFVEKVERMMRMCQIFRVNSLAEVEKRFGVLVPRDILTHPLQDFKVMHPGGAFLNFIVLYTPTVPSILGLARRIEEEGKLSAKRSRLAEAARLSLALQILKILARLALRGIVLRSFDLTHLKLDANGRVFIDAYAEPEEEDLRVTHASSGHASTSGGERSGRPINRHSNAKTATLVLAYLWCPVIIRRLYTSATQPTGTQLLEALHHSACPPVPQEIIHIITIVWEKYMDASELIFTQSYMGLYTRLRDLRSEEGADASG